MHFYSENLRFTFVNSKRTYRKCYNLYTTLHAHIYTYISFIYVDGYGGNKYSFILFLRVITVKYGVSFLSCDCTLTYCQHSMTGSDYKTEGQSAQFSSQLQFSQYAQCEKCDPFRVHDKLLLEFIM